MKDKLRMNVEGDKYFMKFAESGGTSDTSDYVTVGQFADLCGVSRQTISALIKKHRLKTKLLGTMTLVKRYDAMQFKPQMVNKQIRMRRKGD